MSYGGLRGAVAFALALLINPRYVKRREMFVTTTIAVIYFTVFIQVRLLCTLKANIQLVSETRRVNRSVEFVGFRE